MNIFYSISAWALALTLQSSQLWVAVLQDWPSCAPPEIQHRLKNEKDTIRMIIDSVHQEVWILGKRRKNKMKTCESK